MTYKRRGPKSDNFNLPVVHQLWPEYAVPWRRVAPGIGTRTIGRDVQEADGLKLQVAHLFCEVLSISLQHAIKVMHACTHAPIHTLTYVDFDVVSESAESAHEQILSTQLQENASLLMSPILHSSIP